MVNLISQYPSHLAAKGSRNTNQMFAIQDHRRRYKYWWLASQLEYISFMLIL